MRRVVITGIGSVNPLGETAEKSWQNLLSGQSGAGPITGFDVSDLPCQIACHIDRADEQGKTASTQTSMLSRKNKSAWMIYHLCHGGQRYGAGR